VFYQQWQQETLAAGGPVQQVIKGADAWCELRRVLKPRRGYAFIPAEAEAACWRSIRRRQQRVAAIAGLAVIGLLCLPFLHNAVRKAWLERQLETHLAQSASARESQAAVLAMEDEWGAVLEYPRQDVAGILLEL